MTSHLTFLKKFKHSPKPSRSEFLIAAYRVFLRPLFSELAGGVIFTPLSAARSARDLSAALFNIELRAELDRTYPLCRTHGAETTSSGPHAEKLFLFQGQTTVNIGHPSQIVTDIVPCPRTLHFRLQHPPSSLPPSIGQTPKHLPPSLPASLGDRYPGMCFIRRYGVQIKSPLTPVNPQWRTRHRAFPGGSVLYGPTSPVFMAGRYVVIAPTGRIAFASATIPVAAMRISVVRRHSSDRQCAI